MKPPLDQLGGLAWAQIWQVTLVALVVAVLVRLFCRRRAHLAYMLWMLVILKCLTPPIWSSPTGVFSWATARAAASAPAEAAEQTAVSTRGPEEVPMMEEAPPGPGRASAPISSETFARPQPGLEAPKRPLRAATVLGLIWLSGSLAYVVTAIGTRLKWSWLLRNSSLAADAALVALVAELSKRLGVKRQVRLLVTQEPFGPVAYGVFRPTLLLPGLLWCEKSPRQIEAVLAHELIHVRRGDNAAGILQLAAQAIWWFHPLVWWANRQLCRERERCCDEEAVARLGCEPGQYAQGLLDVLKLKQKLRPVFAFPGVRPGEITSKRMEEIMEPRRRFHRRTPRWCWLVGLAAAALVLPGRELVVTQAAEAPKSDKKEVTSVAAKQPPGLTLRLVARDCSTHASISPDGRYLCDVVFEPAPRGCDLLIRELATGQERRIKWEAFGEVAPLWPTGSPDGKNIAFASYDSKKEAYEAHLIGIDGSGDRVLRADFWPAGWSSDGKRLLGWFVRKDPSRHELVWYSIADGSVHVVKST